MIINDRPYARSEDREARREDNESKNRVQVNRADARDFARQLETRERNSASAAPSHIESTSATAGRSPVKKSLIRPNSPADLNGTALPASESKLGDSILGRLLSGLEGASRVPIDSQLTEMVNSEVLANQGGPGIGLKRCVVKALRQRSLPTPKGGAGAGDKTSSVMEQHVRRESSLASNWQDETASRRRRDRDSLDLSPAGDVMPAQQMDNAGMITATPVRSPMVFQNLSNLIDYAGVLRNAVGEFEFLVGIRRGDGRVLRISITGHGNRRISILILDADIGEGIDSSTLMDLVDGMRNAGLEIIHVEKRAMPS